MASSCELKYVEPENVYQVGEASGFIEVDDVPEDSFLNFNARNLAKYVEEQLRLDPESERLLGQAIDDLSTFLTERKEFIGTRVFKGGSLGKDTIIRGLSDFDLIVFLDDFLSHDNFSDNIQDVLEKLRTVLMQFGYRGGHRVEVDSLSRFYVKVSLKPNGWDDSIEVEVIPAHDNKNGKDSMYSPQTVQSLSRAESSRHHLHFSYVCPLQVELVKTQPAALKDLIRLVKYWRKTHFEERTDSRHSLPTSYTLELLTIHSWQKAGAPHSFNLGKGFKAVMGELVHYENIVAVWSQFYDPKDYRADIARLKEKSKMAVVPFILDPANPFNNTAARFRAWDEVSHVAKLSRNKLLALACDYKWT